MPGQRAPKSVRAQRHQFALARLAQGVPISTVVAAVADEWGCSRRQARNVCRAAMEEISGDLEVVDFREMLSSTIHRLERLAAKAEAAKQYSAAIGAVNSLSSLVLMPQIERRLKHPGRS